MYESPSIHESVCALGGQGFLLGDGRVNYNTEQIVAVMSGTGSWPSRNALIA
jgi:hypothetical protein